METELDQKQTVLNDLKKTLESDFLEKLKEVQEQWLSKEKKMKAAIREKIEEGRFRRFK